MAKAPQKSSAQPTPAPAGRRRRRRRQSGGGGGGMIVLLFLAILMSALFNLNLAFFLVLFMIPTFVLSTSSKAQHHAAKLATVMMMNLAGVTPFAMMIWDRPLMFNYILFDPVKVAMMLGAAAMGYVLLWVCPVVAATVLTALAQDKLKNIAAQRKELLELFGPEVLGDTENKPAKP